MVNGFWMSCFYFRVNNPMKQYLCHLHSQWSLSCIKILPFFNSYERYRASIFWYVTFSCFYFHKWTSLLKGSWNRSICSQFSTNNPELTPQQCFYFHRRLGARCNKVDIGSFDGRRKYCHPSLYLPSVQLIR